MVLILCFSVGCQTVEKSSEPPNYLRFVGDIEPDAVVDDPGFTICSENGPVMQYFKTGEGFRFEGEKTALLKAIQSEYKPFGNAALPTGYVRIRFVVNCNGNAGRFRVLTSDSNFEPVNFDKELTNQFVHILSQLDGWKKMIKNETALDYYTYIIVKLENGIMKEILP